MHMRVPEPLVVNASSFVFVLLLLVMFGHLKEQIKIGVGGNEMEENIS